MDYRTWSKNLNLLTSDFHVANADFGVEVTYSLGHTGGSYFIRKWTIRIPGYLKVLWKRILVSCVNLPADPKFASFEAFSLGFTFSYWAGGTCILFLVVTAKLTNSVSSVSVTLSISGSLHKRVKQLPPRRIVVFFSGPNTQLTKQQI